MRKHFYCPNDVPEVASQKRGGSIAEQIRIEMTLHERAGLQNVKTVNLQAWPEFALRRAIPFARTPRQMVSGDLVDSVASSV